MQLTKAPRFPLFAFAEWLLVLPAAALLGAAALRPLQPRQFEPAHTAWLVFQWTAQHLTRFAAAIIFLALPALVCMFGFTALWSAWREDAALRDDLRSTLTLLRRRLAAISVFAATSLAALILLFALSRIIAD